MEQQTMRDALIQALQATGTFNANVEVAPVVILWPDKARQWEPLVPQLRESLPLLTLGAYDPASHTGPAIWVRALLSGTLPDAPTLRSGIPILYLPGVSKEELRAVEDCPPLLKPLAELQYRGVLFAQPNGLRDWTITAFLHNRERGLGIEVDKTNATNAAIARALLKLADEPVERLRQQAPLRASFFDALLNPDEPLRILRWLDDPEGFQTHCAHGEWEALRGICQTKYAFDPLAAGAVGAARLLGQREGAWDVVWRRFAEAPAHYRHIPEYLRAAHPQDIGLFDPRDAWPQENEADEASLRAALLGVRMKTPNLARGEILSLEERHGPRRASVWATLGQAPVANALESLARLALAIERDLSAKTVPEITAAYVDWGWEVDAAALAALRAVTTPEDTQAIRAALTAIYRPWLTNATTAFQSASLRGYHADAARTAGEGECLIFCDGLRFDLGQAVHARLTERGYVATITPHLAALPTVTSTAKPAISPAAAGITGAEKLETKLTATGQRVTAEVLRTTLQQLGYQTLPENATGDPHGRGWTEMGAIDSYGHQHSDRLAHHVIDEIELIATRVAALIEAGWRQVTVITDHGWLYLPDGLPKMHLAEHLTEVRKGRCARLTPAATPEALILPWTWDASVTIAYAPDLHCFEAGKEYEHGGLSAQECVTPVVTITAGMRAVPVTIAAVKWRGLRCVVTVEGGAPGMQVDLRTRSGEPSSSLLDAPKLVNVDGAASIIVPDDAAEGHSAIVLITDAQGIVRAQQPTIVGGE